MIRQPKPTDRPLEPDVTTESPSLSIAEARKSGVWHGVTYQLRRCGWRFYWYAVWYDAQSGKTRNAYIGKVFRELTADEF